MIPLGVMASGHVEVVAGGGGLTNIREAGAMSFRSAPGGAQTLLTLSDTLPTATRWVVLLAARRDAATLPTVTLDGVSMTGLTDAGSVAAFAASWPTGVSASILAQWTDGAWEGGLVAWALDAHAALVVDDLSRANPATVTNATGSAAFAATINTLAEITSPDIPATTLGPRSGWYFHYGHTTAPGSLTFPTGSTSGALASIGAA